MNRLAGALAGIALAGLGGCSAVAPFATIPAEPQPGDTGPRVGICYNSLHSTPDQVRKAAQAECPADSVAEPVDTDWYMEHCPLLLPTRATFMCVKR